MELLRFSVFWCGTILFGSVLLEEAGELSCAEVFGRLREAPQSGSF